VQKIKTHFVFSKFFFPENRVVCEIMWKNIVQPDMTQMTVRRMHIACWISKATDTHSEYVIFIALPLQQRLHEHAPVFSYTYIACLVSSVRTSSEGPQ
jgi:hypothetical protein